MAGLASAAAAVGTAARTKTQAKANQLKAASAGLLGTNPEISTLEEAFDTLRGRVLTVATGVRRRAKKGATVASDSLQALRRSGRQSCHSEAETAVQRLMDMGFAREDAEEMRAVDAIATAQLIDTRDDSISEGNTAQAQMKLSFRNVQATVNKTKHRVETIIGKPTVEFVPQQHAMHPKAQNRLDETPVGIDAKRQMVYEATERRLVQVQARNGGTMEDWRRQRCESQKAHAHKNASSMMVHAGRESDESPDTAVKAERGVWLGADEMIVSDEELEMQRALAASLGAEPVAQVAASSASSSSSSSSSSCGSSHSMAKSSSTLQTQTSCTLDAGVPAPVPDVAPRDFKRLPSVASWLVPLPLGCSAQQEALFC